MLLKAFPKDRDYLQRCAAAHFASGEFDRSLDCWRTLLAGCPRGSDDWFEAKYHQIACLKQVDPETAEKVGKQFRFLYPDLGGAEWREKFEEVL